MRFEEELVKKVNELYDLRNNAKTGEDFRTINALIEAIQWSRGFVDNDIFYKYELLSKEK